MALTSSQLTALPSLKLIDVKDLRILQHFRLGSKSNKGVCKLVVAWLPGETGRH